MAKTKKHSPLTATDFPLELGRDPDDKQEHFTVLIFEVGGESYAISVEYTEGVVDCPRITPLPSPPDGVAGIVSVRGRMTVVMDLGPKMSEEVPRRRLILVKGESQLGLLADRIEGVRALAPKMVRTVAGSNDTSRQRGAFLWPAGSYFKSAERRVPILDVERLYET